MKVILLALLSLLLSYSAHAQDESYANFKFGNALYAEAKYDKAVNEYEGVLNKGLESGYLYYNLGNTYFKLGKLGEAILNYEKAKRFIPRDADLNANFKFALSRIGVSEERPAAIKEMALSFTNLEFTTCLITIYLLFIVMLGLRLWIKNNHMLLNYTAMLLCLLLFLVGVLFTVNVYYTRPSKNAIVLADEVNVRFAPQDNATVFFELSEGEKVTVKDINGEWTKVERSDEREGWVRLKSLGLI